FHSSRNLGTCRFISFLTIDAKVAVYWSRMTDVLITVAIGDEVRNHQKGHPGRHHAAFRLHAD
ncbi:hypothetical protein, partial [Rhizobium sp. Pop5]|uniref:hypothetical protein n=1 Tax=Rhizobium sp. Pop5 TaxID=1223565 RepID=UPI001969BAF6